MTSKISIWLMAGMSLALFGTSTGFCQEEKQPAAFRYEKGLKLYSQERYEESLDSIVNFLKIHPDDISEQELNQAVYLANLMIEHKLRPDEFEKLSLQNILNPHYLNGMRQLRNGNREKAVSEFGLVIIEGRKQKSASLYLAGQMLEELVDLKNISYLPYFERKYEHAINLALGSNDHPYLLLKNENKILHLDAEGAILEEIPFQVKDLDFEHSFETGFIVFSDGQFLVSNRKLDRGGREILRYAYRYAADVWVDSLDRIYTIHPEGLGRFSSHGKIEWYESASDFGDTRFPLSHSLGMAVSGKRIYVSDDKLIWIFDETGHLKDTFGVKGKQQWIFAYQLRDITSDRNGFIYVMDQDGISVFDDGLNFITEIRKVYANKITVNRNGIIYTLDYNGSLKAYIPLRELGKQKQEAGDD